MQCVSLNLDLRDALSLRRTLKAVLAGCGCEQRRAERCGTCEALASIVTELDGLRDGARPAPVRLGPSAQPPLIGIAQAQPAHEKTVGAASSPRNRFHLYSGGLADD